MSDYLSDEEQLARMKSWWGEYGTTVIISISIAVVVIVGWRWWQVQQAESIAAASDVFDAYVLADESGKPELADELADNFAGSAYHTFVLFEQAKVAVDAGDLGTAQTQLQSAIENAPDDILRDLARIRLAKVLRGLDQQDAALAVLDAIASAGHRAWALETQGDIYASLGDVEQAHKAYSAAVQSLTDGIDRPLLKMKMDDTAPFGEIYVQIESSLSTALTKAQKTLAETGTDGSADGQTGQGDDNSGLEGVEDLEATVEKISTGTEELQGDDEQSPTSEN